MGPKCKNLIFIYLVCFLSICIQAKRRSYTQLHKEREEFRKRLVILITKRDVESTSGGVIPSADEAEIWRYYCFIRYGIDTIHIAPIENTWLQHIYSLIPQKLKLRSQSLKELTEEVQVILLSS